MEEDIKNLSEIIELSKKEILNKDENITAVLDITDLTSLMHLISSYKKLEEENEEWQKAYQEEKDAQFNILIDSIPKSVIEDKIKWLDDMTKDETKQFCYANYRYTRNILEELLKKGNK